MVAIVIFFLFLLFPIDWQKTKSQRERETLLLEELVKIVDKRNELVQNQDCQEKAYVDSSLNFTSWLLMWLTDWQHSSACCSCFTVQCFVHPVCPSYDYSWIRKQCYPFLWQTEKQEKTIDSHSRKASLLLCSLSLPLYFPSCLPLVSVKSKLLFFHPSNFTSVKTHHFFFQACHLSLVFMLLLSFASFRWSPTMICLSCLHEGLILDTHFRKFLCLLSLSIEHETGGSCKVSSLISNSIHYKGETRREWWGMGMNEWQRKSTEKKASLSFFLINTGGKIGLLFALFANMSHRIISHFLIVHLFSNSLTLFDTDSIFSIPFFSGIKTDLKMTKL